MTEATSIGTSNNHVRKCVPTTVINCNNARNCIIISVNDRHYFPDKGESDIDMGLMNKLARYIIECDDIDKFNILVNAHNNNIGVLINKHTSNSLYIKSPPWNIITKCIENEFIPHVFTNDTTVSIYRDTLAHFVCWNLHHNLIIKLIEHKYDMFETNSYGLTPLAHLLISEYLAKRRSPEMIKTIEAFATLNLRPLSKIKVLWTYKNKSDISPEIKIKIGYTIIDIMNTILRLTASDPFFVKLFSIITDNIEK